MQMEEIVSRLHNCPRCGRHCPIDQTNCQRGNELVDQLLSGQISFEDTLLSKSQTSKHGNHLNDYHSRNGEDHLHRHHSLHKGYQCHIKDIETIHKIIFSHWPLQN